MHESYNIVLQYLDSLRDMTASISDVSANYPVNKTVVCTRLSMA